MKGVTVNILEVLLIIIGLAIVVLFVVKFGKTSMAKTFSVLSLMNQLKGGG